MRRTVPRHAAHTTVAAARTTAAGSITLAAAARTGLAVIRRHPRLIGVAGLALLALRPPRR